MHEAGLLSAAIAEALAAAAPAGAAGPPDDPAPGRPMILDIRVRDPIHVAPESARLHAELALRARGLVDVDIRVTADPVVCMVCDVANDVVAGHPFCAACGWPLPDRDGHAVEAVIRPAGEVPV